MSMISTQCDELRKTADELQDLVDKGHNYTWSGFYSTLHYAQQVLRRAADTIWELRCKLAGEVDQQDEIERLRDENDRLRELVIRMHPTCIQGKRCTFADKLYICKTMEELGIKVTENE